MGSELMARYQGWFALSSPLPLPRACFWSALRFSSVWICGAAVSSRLRCVQPATSLLVVIRRWRLSSGSGSPCQRPRRRWSTLQTVGTNQLVLQLPGEQDPTAARILGDTALLEFRAQSPGTNAIRSLRQLQSGFSHPQPSRGSASSRGNARAASLELSKTLNDFGIESPSFDGDEQLKALLNKVDEELISLLEPAALTGKQLVSAGRQPLQNNPNSWEVTLNFDAEGAEAFADLTQSIAGTDLLLAITLDNRLISAASVGPQFKSAGISGGAATISGNFSSESARELEVKLRGGSLPLPVEVIEVRTIGPTLGAENIRRSLQAALSGLALVAVFMVVAYRLPGAVAVAALSLYALFNLSVYALIPVTLTLPGIAGFILSIGMAVDANVLIFERIKDELRRGNTLIRSIDTGFSEAFSSILDGHLTTLISCAALFFLGTGLVKGFAATLGIGVLLSLFTALTCTRTLLRFLMGYAALRRPSNFLPQGQLPTKIA